MRRSKPLEDEEAEEEEEETNAFRCTKQGCSMSFEQRRRLNSHIKDVHCPAIQRTCTHCDREYRSMTAAKAHESRCAKRPDLDCTVTFTMPPMTVGADPIDPTRCAKHMNRKYVPVEKYIAMLQPWMLGGNYLWACRKAKATLAPGMLNSYILAIRQYLQVIINGLMAKYSEEILTEEQLQRTYRWMMGSSIQLSAEAETATGKSRP